MQHVRRQQIEELLHIDVEGAHVVHFLDVCTLALEQFVVDGGEVVERVAEVPAAMQPQRVHAVEHLVTSAGVVGPVPWPGQHLVDAVTLEVPRRGRHLGHQVAGVRDVVDVAVVVFNLGFGLGAFRQNARRHAVAVAVQVALAHLDVAAEERADVVAFLVGELRRAVLDGVFDDVAGGEIGGGACARLAADQDFRRAGKAVFANVAFEEPGCHLGGFLEALVVAGGSHRDVAAPLDLVVAAAHAQKHQVVFLPVHGDLAVAHAKPDRGLRGARFAVRWLTLVGAVPSDVARLASVNGDAVAFVAVALDVAVFNADLVHEAADVAVLVAVLLVGATARFGIDGRNRQAASEGRQVGVVRHGPAAEERRLENERRRRVAVVVPMQPSDHAIGGSGGRGRCRGDAIRLCGLQAECLGEGA